MKMGVRKPSIKKSISARTTGRAKRAMKKSVIPGYGQKGTGIYKNPSKAMYNKVYNKTTVSAKDLVEGKSNNSNSSSSGICTVIAFIVILFIIFIFIFF